MSLHRIASLSACLTVASVGLACDLGPKAIGGAPVGHEDGAEYRECGASTLTLIDDHQAALAGFDKVVSEYLALTEGTYLGDFDWLSDTLMTAHAGSSSPLTMTVTYTGGEIRLTEVELVGQSGSGGFGFPNYVCANILQIDVTLDFATEDGLFAETITAAIRVFSHDETHDGGVSLPSFNFGLDMDAHQGLLSLEDIDIDIGDDDDDAEIDVLLFAASFDEDLVLGDLIVQFSANTWIAAFPIAKFAATRQP
jgi:hypothetical protein